MEVGLVWNKWKSWVDGEDESDGWTSKKKDEDLSSFLQVSTPFQEKPNDFFF